MTAWLGTRKKKQSSFLRNEPKRNENKESKEYAHNYCIAESEDRILVFVKTKAAADGIEVTNDGEGYYINNNVYM